MCGIAGILKVHPPGQAPPPPWVAIPEAWLDILDESVKHRGPDGHGRFRDRAVRPDGSVVDVAFVHRRLSIIDHAGGHQPMVLGGTGLAPGDSAQTGDATAEAYRRTAEHALNPCSRCAALGCGTVAVVFNGCIYNHRELRKELQAAGHEFSTDHSDTEVLVHGWSEWGLTLDSRLDGMFARVTWDGRRGVLVFARDPFGEKPLYSSPGSERRRSGISAFASSVPPLLRLRALTETHERNDAAGFGIDARPWIKFGWNQFTPLNAVREELWGGIRVLPREEPGVGQDDGSSSSHAQWVDVLQSAQRRVTADEVDSALSSAVASRLEADVPMGCFLSGGIDSALVCQYARRARSDITAFTVRMPHPACDESAAASITARALGVRHEILDCDPRPADDLGMAIRQLGLPFGDSSLLPSLWVSRAARGRAAVALSGDGGDEMFCGYDRFRAVRPLTRLSRVPAGLLRSFAAFVPASANPKSARSRLVRLLNAAAGEGYKELVAIFDPPHDRAVGLGVDRSGHFGMTLTRGLRHTQILARRFDLMFYLPGDLMRKTDTASMSVALEVRAPFLARDVARLGIHASIASLMPRGQRKGLLRAVARKYFPPEIVDRPKRGFAIPIGEWFRSDYGGMRQLLLDHLNGPEPFGPDHLGINAMINMDFVKRMLREHDDAGVKSIWPWKGRDHSQRLYMMLVLSIWAKWLGGL
ncbi:MAG: asparagine synthetase B family protein [Phycisphaerales bacterium]